MDGTNLTVLNSYFHDNQQGIFSSPNPGSQVLVQSTEFNHNGSGDGYTHNIHINAAARFTMQYSNSRNALAGSLVKTLASENYVLYNRLTSESGTTSLEMDIDSGGRSFVIGNLIQKGPNDQGANLLGYLLSGSSPNPSTELYMGNLAPASSIPVNITIDFSKCTTAARFTATLGMSANGGATTASIVRYNQFP